MGLLGKVSSLKAKEQKGLLHKSLQALNKIASDVEISRTAVGRRLQTEEGKPSERKDPRNTLSKIARLSRGIDAPAYLFHLIQQFIGFQKGVLFLADRNTGAWIPLASAGWKWGAEIAFSRVDSLMPELDTQSSRVFDRRKIEGFFRDSSKEAVESAILKPFYHEEQLIGLLMFEGRASEAIAGIKAIITSDAHRIVRSQYDYLTSFAEDILGDYSSFKEELDRIQRQIAEQPDIVVRISFDAVIHALKQEMPCISPVWLHRILSHVFASLYDGIGVVYEGTNNHVFLLLPGDMAMDAELAAHQSALSLRLHFHEVELPYHVSFEVMNAGDILGTEK